VNKFSFEEATKVSLPGC